MGEVIGTIVIGITVGSVAMLAGAALLIGLLTIIREEIEDRRR